MKRKALLTGDGVFAGLLHGLALLLVVLFVALLGYLVHGSWPAIRHFGVEFLWSTTWSPAHRQFGALPAIVGTLVTAALSIAIAVPVSVGTAILLTHILDRTAMTAKIIGRLVELLAGIPSIIYGMWGLFFLAPFMADHIQPALIETFRSVPILNFVFGGVPIGIGVFTASIVLAIMIIPLIASMMRDIIAEVPKELVESVYAVGATRSEMLRRVILPYARAGLLGSCILGFGRVLGETMAVTFVIGNSHTLFKALFEPGTTISAAIANEFTEATGSLYLASLVELGLLLFFITFIVITLSRYVLHRAKTRGGSL